jgi:hypothetical protein
MVNGSKTKAVLLFTIYYLRFTNHQVEKRTMESPLSYRMQTAMKSCALLACIVTLSSVARGQVIVSQLTAPPPIKFISRNERAQLSVARDAKERTGISIELAEGHLSHAENATFTHSYDAAAAALGRYQAMMEDALRFLSTMNTDSKKMRDLCKRLELTLRTHVSRIEAIRRDTPFDYAINIKAALEYARKARTQALDAFFSDTVIPEESPGGHKSSDEAPQNSPSEQTKNQ